MKKIKFCTVFATLGLAACFDGSGIRPAEKMLSHGWAEPSYEDAEHTRAKYCYRSLGDIDCFDTPQAGRDAQLVADYPPKLPNKPFVSHSWVADQFNHELKKTQDCGCGKGTPPPSQTSTAGSASNPRLSDDPQAKQNIDRMPLSAKGAQ